jgi:hypothetical protein
MALDETSQQEILRLILSRSLYELVESEHHNQCIKVFFVQCKINLRKVLQPYLLPDQYDRICREATRQSNNYVQYIASVYGHKISQSCKGKYCEHA